MQSWGEAHRRYHDRQHLIAVLDRLDELDPPDPRSPVVEGSAGWSARMAAFYHDAVYRIGADDNEAASADRAATDLATLGYGEVTRSEVSRLILATTSHVSASGDRAANMVCDADLAVLGGMPAAYAAYVAAVRKEYAVLDDDAWRQGRSKVLVGLVSRPHLFATPDGYRRWEHTARLNLVAELRSLGPTGAPVIG